MAIVKRLIGNVSGPQGPQGVPGVQGNPGKTGPRGSRWTIGTAIDGMFTDDTVCSATGISDALVNDHYLNPNTGNIYRCTLGGDANTATWVWVGQLETGTAVEITTDKTLKIEGDAADAKAVGDAIADAKEAISEEIKTEINLASLVVGDEDPGRKCLWFNTSTN